MESGKGNAKKGCGRWMEECGRGAAVEQLTARGTEYQSPRWGAIETTEKLAQEIGVSIPAMGGNSRPRRNAEGGNGINPRNGGQ